MIIPIRCMNCGFVLGDKWRYYQHRVAQLRNESGLGKEPVYIDGTSIPDTPERKVFDELGIVRYCCRKHLLTHRDLIDKI
uniref:DNA-directed RNA polymerase n=1 Tax=viral metagenome TaxID=1070528 RepID=A0A6C0HEX7_9ZZZZ